MLTECQDNEEEYSKAAAAARAESYLTLQNHPDTKLARKSHPNTAYPEFSRRVGTTICHLCD
jgi:hypothetical protein